MANGNEPKPITYEMVRTNYVNAKDAFTKGFVENAVAYLTQAVLYTDVLEIEAKTSADAIKFKKVSNTLARLQRAIERGFKNRDTLEKRLDEMFEKVPTTPS